MRTRETERGRERGGGRDQERKKGQERMKEPNPGMCPRSAPAAAGSGRSSSPHPK